MHAFAGTAKVRLRFFPLLFLTFLLLPGVSRGETTGLSGFDLRLFRPPADGSGHLNLHGSRSLGRWKFSLGSISDTSQGVLKVTNPLTADSVKVVDQYFTNLFVGSVGLTDFFQVGLSLPTVYFEQGEHFETGEPFTTAALGDIGLETKLALLKDSGLRPGIALVSITTFPTGSTERFTGSSNVTEEAKLVVDKKIGPVTLILNGGYRVIPRTQVADLEIDDMATYGAGFSWSLPFGSMDLIAEADGALVLGNPRERTSPLEWLAGLRQRVFEGLSIEFAGGSGVGSGVGGGDFRIVAGLTFRNIPQEKKSEETLLSETISFQKGRSKVDRKSETTLDRVVDLLKGDKKNQVELTGDPELTGIVMDDLMARGVSRGRMSANPPEPSETKTRTVAVRVVK
ncbi:MAG TPA: hypothetical protein VLJ37_01770 [bacterium]|nr:hypothetical protein [bacterium]